MKRAHSLQEIVDAGWAPSVLFLQRHIRSGDIPAHKVGRSWFMDDDDLEAFKESTRNVPRRVKAVEAPKHGGLSAVSASRRAS